MKKDKSPVKKDKSPVKIRERKLKDGNISLFLDTYEHGQHTYEFLHLYIVPERSPIDKERNKVTRMQAETQRARRVIEKQNGMYGRVAQSSFSKFTLLDVINRKLDTVTGSNKYHYVLLGHHVERYGDALMKNVTPDYIVGFLRYLKTAQNRAIKNEDEARPLSKGTIKLLYTVLNASLNKAVRDRLIQSNPCSHVDKSMTPKKASTKLCYLTIDELRALANTECSNNDIKRAFIFACYTGLRISDIKTLKYSDIISTDIGYAISINQEKTNEFVSIPLSSTALQCIGTIPADAKERAKAVFKMPSVTGMVNVLDRWVKKSGIEKHVTFHTSRHTAATLLLTYGADLYTVSKILGHKSIATTQIYAEVVNEKKIAAVEAMPTLD